MNVDDKPLDHRAQVGGIPVPVHVGFSHSHATEEDAPAKEVLLANRDDGLGSTFSFAEIATGSVGKFQGEASLRESLQHFTQRPTVPRSLERSGGIDAGGGIYFRGSVHGRVGLWRE